MAPLSKEQCENVLALFDESLTNSATDPRGLPVGFATACRKLGYKWAAFEESRQLDPDLSERCRLLEEEAKELAADRALGQQLARGTKAKASPEPASKAPLLHLLENMDDKVLAQDSAKVAAMLAEIRGGGDEEDGDDY